MPHFVYQSSRERASETWPWASSMRASTAGSSATADAWISSARSWMMACAPGSGMGLPWAFSTVDSLAALMLWRTQSTKCRRTRCLSTLATSGGPHLAALALPGLSSRSRTASRNAPDAAAAFGTDIRTTTSRLWPYWSTPRLTATAPPSSFAVGWPPRGTGSMKLAPFIGLSVRVVSLAMVTSRLDIALTKTVPTKPASGMKAYAPEQSIAIWLSSSLSSSLPNPKVLTVHGSLPPSLSFSFFSIGRMPRGGLMFGSPSVKSIMCWSLPGCLDLLSSSNPVFRPSQRFVMPKGWRSSSCTSVACLPFAVISVRSKMMRASFE
mmetsp:Transcript_75274/g.212901  ORF Transcript_75274/g.212901 Transcript_75274/m.212901 type:complete len:323 (-) Transcript_75274:381-1349(-)